MKISHQNLNNMSWVRGGVNLLVSVGTNSRRLIIFTAVYIGAIIKCSTATSNWPPSSLVHKMPMKTCEGSVLIAFVLQKEWTLLSPKFLQISEMTREVHLLNAAKIISGIS